MQGTHSCWILKALSLLGVIGEIERLPIRRLLLARIPMDVWLFQKKASIRDRRLFVIEAFGH
jgi:hypothetical protein